MVSTVDGMAAASRWPIFWQASVAGGCNRGGRQRSCDRGEKKKRSGRKEREGGNEAN